MNAYVPPAALPSGGFTVDDAVYGADQDVPRVGSVADLLSVMTTVLNGQRRELWFRGHRKLSWKLEPTFFRDSARPPMSGTSSPDYLDDIGMRTYDTGDLNALLDVVAEVLEAAGQRDVPRSEVLLFAQHYGVSTPLLDWSTSALIAVWFALHNLGHLDDNDPPVLWILDPEFINTMAPFQGLPAAPGVDIATAFKHLGSNLGGSTIPQETPLALYSTGQFASRVARQSGKFTFSGPGVLFRNVVPGGTVYDGQNTRAFAPILLDAARATSFLDELRILGVSRETVFGPQMLDREIELQLKERGLRSDGRLDEPSH